MSTRAEIRFEHGVDRAPYPSPHGVEVMNPLQVTQWDELLSGHEDATVFHTSGWARVLAETYGFRPHYLVRRLGGHLLGIWPLMETGGRWRGYRGISLPFTDACPPLLGPEPAVRSSEAFNAAERGSWFEGAEDGAAAERTRLVPSRRLRGMPCWRRVIRNPVDAGGACPGTAGSAGVARHTGLGQQAGGGWESLESRILHQPLLSAALTLARHRGWRSIELRNCLRWTAGIAPSVSFYGHAIDLTVGERALFARFSSAARRAVRKADRSPLSLSEGAEMSDVEAYFEVHCRTRHRHGLPPQPFAFFQSLHRHLIRSGSGFVLLARREGVPVAGAVILSHGQQATYKFGASDENHFCHRPNNLILWEAIRRCAARGCTRLDLGRTSLDNDGLRWFKLGLGSEEQLIRYHRQDLHTGQIQAMSDRTTGWHARILRHLPSALGRLAGSLFYRYVS